MHEIVAVDTGYLSTLCEELEQIDRAFSIDLLRTNGIDSALSLSVDSDRSKLKMGYD